MTTVNRNSASDVLRHLGKQSEGAGEGAAKALANLSKAAIDVVSGNVKQGVLLAGSVWVAEKSFEDVVKALNGKDIGPLHTGTSGVDQAVAIGLFTASGLVASGIAVKNALEIAANLIDAAKKG